MFRRDRHRAMRNEYKARSHPQVFASAWYRMNFVARIKKNTHFSPFRTEIMIKTAEHAARVLHLAAKLLEHCHVKRRRR